MPRGCQCTRCGCTNGHCECRRRGRTCLPGVCLCGPGCGNPPGEEVAPLPRRGCRCSRSGCTNGHCECHRRGLTCLPGVCLCGPGCGNPPPPGEAPRREEVALITPHAVAALPPSVHGKKRRRLFAIRGGVLLQGDALPPPIGGEPRSLDDLWEGEADFLSSEEITPPWEDEHCLEVVSSVRPRRRRRTLPRRYEAPPADLLRDAP